MIKTVHRSLAISRLENPRYSIVYRLPLGHATNIWTAEDFSQFVRKYAMLTMNKVTILDVVIQYEGVKKDARK